MKPIFLASNTNKQKQIEEIVKFMDNGEDLRLNQKLFKRYSLDYDRSLSLEKQLTDLEDYEVFQIFLDLVHKPTVNLIDWSWKIILLAIGYFLFFGLGGIHQLL